jgi:hypothetical protein
MGAVPGGSTDATAPAGTSRNCNKPKKNEDNERRNEIKKS